MTIHPGRGIDWLVVEFVRELGYEDMPPEVVDQALLCLLDGSPTSHSCYAMAESCGPRRCRHRGVRKTP